ncbi:tRNA-binding protein [Flavobacteriaceae bacterium JJC]|uniref:tRNA-binding protein n=1 Tax=Kaistella soli TaxID=2849654 RepID=UPI000B4B14E6|nr:tRNA-binding protein [Kaistella soli]MBU8883426.1 tRNA-binding protein [Kaistella soli]OWK74834.1 tRNA-binding protein [Flavobacteriaceae bacterium JJC]
MPIKPEISWNDFEKLDIRSGTIVSVSDFPQARNPSYKLEIDFGELGIRNTSAQITDLYQKEELMGKQILAVVNFPKKQIANFFSECLVLGIYGENKEVTLLTTSLPVKNGLQVG